MHTTLEHLEQHIKSQKSLKRSNNLFNEFKTIIIIFVVTFVSMLLFTNAQVFFGWMFWWDETKIVQWDKDTIKDDNTISTVIDQTEQKQEKVEELISKYQSNDLDKYLLTKQIAPTVDQSLRSKLKMYDFDFNILPPVDRLIISKINLDVPLVDSKYKNKTDFAKWDFNEELENGVVKYPTTPVPWENWNTLLFWHTSQEWRSHNPYGTVFSHIPDLEKWDEIKLIWAWKLYKYKIIEKVIVRPRKVNKQYQKYENKWKDYITIMWCYPIWRTDKRMMITAEKIL